MNAKQVAAKMNELAGASGFTGSGFAAFRRDPETGEFSGGAWFSEGSRPRLGVNDRKFSVRWIIDRPYTAAEIEEAFTGEDAFIGGW